MPDEQIFSGKAADGAVEYIVPGPALFTLKTVNAVFTDNGAGGDWLPAVVLVSDSGHVIARAADQAVRVAGGDDAEVSWFPGVKNSGAGFAGLPQARASGAIPSALIPSGVVQTFQWGAVEWSGSSTEPHANSAFIFKAAPTHFDMYVRTVYAYWGVVRLEWAASFAGDRYLEIDVAGGSGMPQRVRAPGTPEGDLLMLPVAFEGGFFTDQLVTVTVFQASGAPQNIADLTVELIAAPGGS